MQQVRMIQIRQEGCDAFEAGLSVEDNPYTKALHPVQHGLWESGWVSGWEDMDYANREAEGQAEYSPDIWTEGLDV